MTASDIRQLKSIVDEFNRAASRPILGNDSMDADQKINALAEIINLADIMAGMVEDIIYHEIPLDGDLSLADIP